MNYRSSSRKIVWPAVFARDRTIMEADGTLAGRPFSLQLYDENVVPVTLAAGFSQRILPVRGEGKEAAVL